MMDRFARTAIVLALVCAAFVMVGCTATEPADEGADRLHATVPDVEGLPLDAADEALAEAGYVLGTVSETTMDDVAPGTVISQSPIAGTSLPRDSAVDVVVQAGSE